jgi:hypothetical protein
VLAQRVEMSGPRSDDQRPLGERQTGDDDAVDVDRPDDRAGGQVKRMQRRRLVDLECEPPPI